MTSPAPSTAKPATILAAMASFCVLASYYLIRPFRDEISAEYPDDVAEMWTYTAVLSLIVMPIYSAMASRSSAARLAPRVYLVVAAILVAFAAIFAAELSANAAVINQSFYVLSSLYALFVVSVLWSTLTSTFTSSASKKHAGRVFAAGTMGGITGSAIVSEGAQSLPPEWLLIGGAIFILPAAWALNELAKAKQAQAAPAESEPTPGASDSTPISKRLETGFFRLLKSPYLLGISGYLLLFVFGSGFLYFIQKDILSQIPDRAERRMLLGRLDLATQILTIGTQILFTAQVIRRWGMALTLIVVPVITVVGFSGLALQPTFVVFAGLMVGRRAMNYALAKPAREILYTVVSPQERYLTKPLLDVGLYRFGDLLAAWFYEGMQKWLAAGTAGMALLGVPFGVAAIPVGRWLGKRQEALADDAQQDANSKAQR